MLTFVHLSDTHITFDETYLKPYARYTPLIGARRLIEEVNALPFTPDFILHTGDVAYDPHAGIYPDIADLFSTLKAPLLTLAGNHDERAALQRVLHGNDDPQPYPYSEREINGVQVLLLDSNANSVEELPAGRISEEQLAWLDTLCAANDDRPLMIAVHHNIVPVGVPWLDQMMGTRNGQEVHEIVRQARDRLRGVFHGHIHQNLDVLRDGVLYSAANSSWTSFMTLPLPTHTDIIDDPNQPPGFSVVNITADHTMIRRHTFTV